MYVCELYIEEIQVRNKQKLWILIIILISEYFSLPFYIIQVLHVILLSNFLVTTTPGQCLHYFADYARNNDIKLNKIKSSNNNNK